MNANQSKSSSKSGRNSTRSLQSREQQYKQLNDELSAKTANLVHEADEFLKAQEKTLSAPVSLLDKISSDELLDWESENGTAESRTNEVCSQHSATASKIKEYKLQPKSRRSSSQKVVQRKSTVGNVTVDADSDSRLDFQQTIANIEGRLNSAQAVSDDDRLMHNDDDDDVMPAVAYEMGADAQIRFLKAKLRVLQEEVDRLSSELCSTEERVRQADIKVKEMEETNGRLQRSNAAQHSQIDKYKKMTEDGKVAVEGLESQVSALKKELDAIKRSHKQQATNQGATEVRLNQAREDVLKYKSSLQKVQADAKEAVDSEKARVEQLLAENKRLEKQKSELMNGFKKQLKLIDVLKRQKMHLEAARMLSFTEEEFVKALEWSS